MRLNGVAVVVDLDIAGRDNDILVKIVGYFTGFQEHFRVRVDFAGQAARQVLCLCAARHVQQSGTDRKQACCREEAAPFGPFLSMQEKRQRHRSHPSS